MLISGIGFGGAALGLFRKRPWGIVLAGATCGLMLIADLAGVATGYSRYEFEMVDPMGRAFLAVLLALSVIAAFKQRRIG